ncbi:Gfo/Idh/MocA family protein [Oceanobacillus bengalensis]|uniref:Gfo/Idh/MocA family oxidoreductase n=1 Tax=Oceanobacillus bengalensis TaxID=1435466 RepID=A0A494Z7I9_9BACI|nr:Gfo/Idh/MocA family oxidoreductase [Oceanobacillus bengalensis]RKQ18555.1 gfo/Idh/MocA family oxidoreductase [Oceanobacillus bengalensis]
MKKVRWGVLSTAGIAQAQLIPAFQRANNAEVTAISSGSGIEKAATVAKKLSIEKSYGSYEQLLDDSDIDAVYIPLPNHLHKEWVMKAAEKGKHILCEKPAALNMEELLEMEQACAKHQVIFMEAFMYFFHAQHERVREIINSGEIGDVKLIRAGFSFPLHEEGNIRYQFKEGGGSMYDIGCYTIHTLRNILEAEPLTVQAHAVIHQKFAVDTDVVAYLQFPNGIRAMFDISFGLTNRSEYEVIGTKGKITVPRAYRPDNQGGDGIIIVDVENVCRTETVNSDQYRNQVEHLSNVILEDHHPIDHDWNNTINNMRTIDACFESIQSGKQVNVN